MNGLREGVSTGTCAAAAAMAAAELAATGFLPSRVPAPLPPFKDGEPSSFLSVPIHSGTLRPVDAERPPCLGAPLAEACVVKDGGDDPDATHGAEIRATLLPVLDPLMAKPNAGRRGDIFLYGGAGVGVATRSGLPVAAGEAAINPVPREQIHFAVNSLREALARLPSPLAVIISVPDGEERARDTLNSRLGVMGGVSILGTHGIVRPFSAEAWTETVKRCLAMADPDRPIVFSTGRRSEKALTAIYPDLPQSSFIQAGDLVAFSLAEAARRPPGLIAWGAFFGKLLKLAQGFPDTRASRGALDLAWLARLHEPREPRIAREIAASTTARNALEILLASPRGKATIDEIPRLAKLQAQRWAGREVVVHLFHENGEELARQ